MLQINRSLHTRAISSCGANKVNTVVAYEIWGIYVKDLEKRLKKIKELNLYSTKLNL